MKKSESPSHDITPTCFKHTSSNVRRYDVRVLLLHILWRFFGFVYHCSLIHCLQLLQNQIHLLWVTCRSRTGWCWHWCHRGFSRNWFFHVFFMTNHWGFHIATIHMVFYRLLSLAILYCFQLVDDSGQLGGMTAGRPRRRNHTSNFTPRPACRSRQFKKAIWVTAPLSRRPVFWETMNLW